MSTKDLIKKMNSSKDVRPTQLKAVMPEDVRVDIVSLNKHETAQQAIQNAVEDMKDPQDIQPNDLLSREIRRINQRLLKLEEGYSAVKDNMEEILIELQEINDKLHEKKPSFWKRIFRKCP